jgi:hypothetical protein
MSAEKLSGESSAFTAGDSIYGGTPVFRIENSVSSLSIELLNLLCYRSGKLTELFSQLS